MLFVENVQIVHVFLCYVGKLCPGCGAPLEAGDFKVNVWLFILSLQKYQQTNHVSTAEFSCQQQKMSENAARLNKFKNKGKDANVSLIRTRR